MSKSIFIKSFGNSIKSFVTADDEYKSIENLHPKNYSKYYK